MIKTENWKHILISAEFVFLVTLISTYMYSLKFVAQKEDKYVHEFDSLDELSHSLITCPIQPQSTDSLRYSANDNVDKLQAKLRMCPIDEDRLGLIDKLRLDTWLNYHHIEKGGTFKPIGCRPRQKVAIVIPYRDRSEHLETFTLYMHQFLPDQLVEYTIYVIEQHDSRPFNRARLFNIGVTEIRKLNPSICCFIFHDVDLIPLDQRNLYMCSYMPRHMSPSVSSLRYSLLYPGLFGGVVAFSGKQYDSIGGFSNDFFGWGGEDDDMFHRVVASGLSIDRTHREHGVYTALKHPKSQPNKAK